MFNSNLITLRRVFLLLAFSFLSPTTVSARSAEELIVITYPLAGAVIDSGTKVFFDPGQEEIYQWRVTIGASPEFYGIYDSGIRLFSEEPWELTVSAVPNDGKPLTLRFWQRAANNSVWKSSDTVFNTRPSDALKNDLLQQASPSESDTPVKVPDALRRPSAGVLIELPQPDSALIPTAPAKVTDTQAVITTGNNTGNNTRTTNSPIKRVAATAATGNEVRNINAARNTNASRTTNEANNTAASQGLYKVSEGQSRSLLSVFRKGPTVKALKAEHRNGQTYITWSEVEGETGYHVYKHNSPINGDNIQDAQRLTGKWGPLDNDTSINKHANESFPGGYVISDLGSPLSATTGLFVHTPSVSGAAYYAVTTVVGNKENIAIVDGQNSLVAAVAETVSDPRPVLTQSINKGKGRLYTQYMDYANWNPTFNGYAYNYTVTLPVGYRKSNSYPLLLRPHAYGEELAFKKESEYGWQVVQIFPQDPNRRRGSIVNSWWFGYAADHNYLTDGPIPTKGRIANFTEARLMRAIKDTIEDPTINVDPQLVHAFGHSMGASGALALGIRYGNVIAGVYGSEAMTNYVTSPKFHGEWEQLWGSQSSNLPVTFVGPYTDVIDRYAGTGVWDWMNHQQQLIERRGDRMAILMLAHGKKDTVVDWATQGAPMASVFNKASVAYSTRYVADAAHSWLGFTGVNKPMFGFGADINFPWRYPLSLSFPAIANASGSGPLQPGNTGDNNYNLDIEWATPHTSFAKSIVDQPGRYEVSIRSKSKSQTADVTPRNSQKFIVAPGEQCGWTAVDSNKSKTVGSGTVVADADGLVTISQVLITPKRGTRLVIECT